MMGENLLYTSNASTPSTTSVSDRSLGPDTPPDQHKHPRLETETETAVLTGAEGCVGEKASRRWNGGVEDGCRHVRWKGLDA